jgi:hypothetical protein
MSGLHRSTAPANLTNYSSALEAQEAGLRGGP